MNQPLLIQPYDRAWPQLAAAEQHALMEATGTVFVALEHIGSTAIPGLAAKPIIDLMGAVERLDHVERIMPFLAALGYGLIETGMPQRLFLRKRDPNRAMAVHLHIVEAATWAERNERLLRDYLQTQPELAAAYDHLKRQLAVDYANDGAAYTQAKTTFIQSVVDRARAARGLPRVAVWEE